MKNPFLRLDGFGHGLHRATQVAASAMLVLIGYTWDWSSPRLGDLLIGILLVVWHAGLFVISGRWCERCRDL